jgi:hypothetical protein
MLAVVTLAPREVTAGFVYHVVNYPTLQNGYTVTGTITTSVDTGTALPTSVITDWNITITGPAITFTITKPSSIMGQIDLTPTAITVASLGDSLRISNNPEQLINWQGPVMSLLIGNFYTAISPTPPFNATQTLWSSSYIPTTQPLGVVPEPSAGVIAVLGAVTVIAYGWSRHRRTKRRQAAA